MQEVEQRATSEDLRAFRSSSPAQAMQEVLRTEQAAMALPPGKTCADCKYFKRCEAFISLSGRETSCDWHPSRFSERQVDPTRCLVPGCDGDPHEKSAARGLCSAHYKTAQLAVSKGETTWEAMEAARRCLPSQRPISAGSARRWLTGKSGSGAAPDRAGPPPRTDAEAVRASIGEDVDTLRALVLVLVERVDALEARLVAS